jgi:uncharacterized protein (TIGR02757 family)
MNELERWLEDLVVKVEVPEYIDTDPVQFMHAYDETEDRLIAAFFAAILAWGRRDIVIRKVGELLLSFGPSPAEFIRTYPEAGSSAFLGWKHRTFTADDIHWLCLSLRRGYAAHGRFEGLWLAASSRAIVEQRLLMGVFHEDFFARIPEAPHRVRKHLSNNENGGSCKRLYLFLRWTMRRNSCVDMPLMSFMPLSELYIPLDVHVGRYARKYGLLTRTQDDWKSVVELTERLRLIDPEDPAKFDYALFGLGIIPEASASDL